MGIDAVGSEVVTGLFEELPERIIVAFFHELQELGAGVVVGTFGVFGQPPQSVGFENKNLGVAC